MNKLLALLVAVALFGSGVYVGQRLATDANGDPDDPRTLARLGLLAFENGDEATAEHALSRAVAQGVEDEGVVWVLDQLQARRADAQAGARLAQSEAEVARAQEAATAAKTRALRAEVRKHDAQAALSKAAAGAAAALARAEVHAGGGCWVELKGTERRSLKIDMNVGGHSLDLVFDTGATTSLITAEAADRIGIDWRSGPRFRASTPGGIIEAPFVALGAVEIAGVVKQAKRIGVCEDCMHFGGDGLFGMDLQSAFEMDVDLQGRRVRIPECEP